MDNRTFVLFSTIPGDEDEGNQMVNERITIRLDEKSVLRADSFIASSDNYGNRSELIRAAINTLIAKETGEELDELEVKVSLEAKVMDFIDFMVAHGRYESRSQACSELIRLGVFELEIENIKKKGLQLLDVHELVSNLKQIEKESLVEYSTR